MPGIATGRAAATRGDASDPRRNGITVVRSDGLVDYPCRLGPRSRWNGHRHGAISWSRARARNIWQWVTSCQPPPSPAAFQPPCGWEHLGGRNPVSTSRQTRWSSPAGWRGRRVQIEALSSTASQRPPQRLCRGKGEGPLTTDSSRPHTLPHKLVVPQRSVVPSRCQPHQLRPAPRGFGLKGAPHEDTIIVCRERSGAGCRRVP